MLKSAYAVAERYDTLFTLHASEMDYEMTYFKDTYGKTSIGFLNDLGVLGSRTLAALMSRQQFRDAQGELFLNETFDGSLPQFFAAFTRRNKLSSRKIDELLQMIDEHREE